MSRSACDSKRAALALHGRSIGALPVLRQLVPACLGACAILTLAVAHVACRILGRLETTVDGRQVDFPSQRERMLLGVLLLHPGEVVSIDAVIDGLWGEAPPRSARHLVHEYVSRLRSGLGGVSLISTRAPGYVVEREACELDVTRFTELVAAGRSALEARKRADALLNFDEALSLWRGDVLCDLALEGDARAAAARLDDQRRAVQSERVDVALALGQHHQLIPDLERAVAAEPLDEQLRGQLILALYRDGRQTDALARYREGRQTLVEQLGIERGEELRALEQAILRHDPVLAQPSTSEAAPEDNGAPADVHRSRASRRAVRVALAAIVLAAVATAAPTAADKTARTSLSV